MLELTSKNFDPHLVRQKDYPNREAWLRALYRANMEKINPSRLQRILMDEDAFVRATYAEAEKLYKKDVASGILNPRYNYIQAADMAIGDIYMNREERWGVSVYYGLQNYADREFVAQFNALIPNFKPSALRPTGERGVFLYSRHFLIKMPEGYDSAEIEEIDAETAWHYEHFGQRI